MINAVIEIYAAERNSMREEKYCDVRRINRRRICLLIGACAAFMAMLFCIWMAVGSDLRDAWNASRVEDRTKALYYNDASVIDIIFGNAYAEEPDGSAPVPEATLPPVQESFNELLSENADTIGWLKVGDIVDYPVVKSDNVFYLDHDFFGEYDDNGTLFLNEYNELFPRDDVLLIHGHNMRSGAMFGDLMLYEDFEYTCENPLVSFRTIYDAEDVYYVPVYAFNASMNINDPSFVDITRMRFEDDAAPDGTSATIRQSTAYNEYLDEMSSVSIWQAPVDVNADDKLLMLITCSYYQDNGRFILICRQLRDGETPESVTAVYSDVLANMEE